MAIKENFWNLVNLIYILYVGLVLHRIGSRVFIISPIVNGTWSISLCYWGYICYISIVIPHIILELIIEVFF